MVSIFGWLVEIVVSGVEVIECLWWEEEVGYFYDVICVDWIMFGMDGWEIVQYICVIYIDVVILVILMVIVYGWELLVEWLFFGSMLFDGLLVKLVMFLMLFDVVVQVIEGCLISVDCCIVVCLVNSW